MKASGGNLIFEISRKKLLLITIEERFNKKSLALNNSEEVCMFMIKYISFPFITKDKFYSLPFYKIERFCSLSIYFLLLLR